LLEYTLTDCSEGYDEPPTRQQTSFLFFLCAERLVRACVFYTAYLARSIFLPLTLALFFAFLLRPIVRLLKKKIRVPEIAGAALMLVSLLARRRMVSTYFRSRPSTG
jgi:predicted PurR-regulated permease PerM